MAEKRIKRPRDPLQLAKLIGDIATGTIEEPKESARSARSRKAGKAGGAARSKALTAEQRGEIARAAAEARWKKS